MNKKLVFGVTGIIGLAISLHSDLFPARAHEPGVVITCSYDLNSDKPNPLGMKTYVTAKEKEGHSIFTYEQFPAYLQPSETLDPVTLSITRTLTFYNLNMSDARVVLRENSNYYSELVGYPDLGGFARLDEVFKCVNS